MNEIINTHPNEHLSNSAGENDLDFRFKEYLLYCLKSIDCSDCFDELTKLQVMNVIETTWDLWIKCDLIDMKYKSII